MTIRQTITLPASAASVYDALTTADQFREVTGAPATIAQEEGGAFSCFDGQITGRHIELVPAQRIVQAWRVANWPDAVYSVVWFELTESGDTCTLSLVHTGYPDDAAEHLEPGWHKMYWQPLTRYLERSS